MYTLLGERGGVERLIHGPHCGPGWRYTSANPCTLAVDPHTWATPWSGEYPMTRTPDAIYEYACHEGNYGMPNVLRAQRQMEERQRPQTPAADTRP